MGELDESFAQLLGRQPTDNERQRLYRVRDALKVKADSAIAYYYLGRTLNKLGKNEDAEKAFLTCLKMSPDDFKEAHRQLAAIYLDRGALPRVVEELDTYLKLVPTAPDADNLRQVMEQSKRAIGRQ